jgi:hypothetical protein
MHSNLYDIEHASLVEAFSGAGLARPAAAWAPARAQAPRGSAARSARFMACSGEHRDTTHCGCGRMCWRLADALRAGPGSRNMPAMPGRRHGVCHVPVHGWRRHHEHRGTACTDLGMGGESLGVPAVQGMSRGC